MFRPEATPAPGLAGRVVHVAAAAQEEQAAHLVRAQLALDEWRERPSESALAEARGALEAAQQAVGQHPDLDALAGELKLGADWDWREAERLYRRAIAADPNNMAARRGLAWLYVNAGREREAWAEVEALIGITPLTPDMRANLGWLMLRMDRADLALATCSVRDSPHINLLSCRHTALARLGSLPEARDAAVVLLEALAADPSTVAAVRDASPEDGYRAFLDWRVRGFLPSGEHWFQRAQIEAEAGRLQEALTSLERAITARDPLAVKIGSTPEFERLASSPRYKALLDQVLASAG